MKIRGYTPAFFFQCIYFSLYFFLMQPQAASLIAYYGDNEKNEDYSYHPYYYQNSVVNFFFGGTHNTATAYIRLTNKFEYTLILCILLQSRLSTLYLNSENREAMETMKNE